MVYRERPERMRIGFKTALAIATCLATTPSPTDRQIAVAMLSNMVMARSFVSIQFQPH